MTEVFNEERRNEPGTERCTPVSQALGRQRQNKQQEPEASLGCTGSLRLARTTSHLKKSKKEQQREAGWKSERNYVPGSYEIRC